MKNLNSGKIVAVAATLLFHLLLLLLLIWGAFAEVIPQEESGGVFMQVGVVEESTGNFESTSPAPQAEEPVVEEDVAQEVEDNQPQTPEESLLTDNSEESVNIEDEERKKREEAERLAEQERIRKEQERLAAEKRAREEAERKLASAFGSTSPDVNSGSSTAGAGMQGNPFGNAPQGETSGAAGDGTSYDLGGRGKVGALPSPTYDTSNDDGVIVVEIVVNPQGKVISAEVALKGSRGSASNNANLRKSAVEAAKRATFVAIKSTSNQMGTITYTFKQR